MAAQIPVKNDEEANDKAFAKVKADKEREVLNGHDGTWVAHPGLVQLAMNVFDQYMPSPNQVHVGRNELQITEQAMLEIPRGTITEAGVRKNINVGILYMESWLRGHGAAALYNLMEDAATAEISRTQLWQWLHNQAELADGRKLNLRLYMELFEDEKQKLIGQVGAERFENGKFDLAIDLFQKLVLNEEFEEFLTLAAYRYL